MTPSQTASRDDRGTTTRALAGTPCPVCSTAFTPTGRQTYCSTTCRKTAFRRRHHQPSPPQIPTCLPRRQVSVYQCSNCGERQTGDQRCPDCNTFGRALGLAGTCPHCDGLIAAADLDPIS